MKPMNEKKLYLLNDDICKCANPVTDRVYLKHTVCRKCGLFIVPGKKK